MTLVNNPREIETISLQHYDDMEKRLRAEVISKAFETFGYVADSFASRGKLAEAMFKLSILAFEPRQVAAYKKSKVKESSDLALRWSLILSGLLLGGVATVYIVTLLHGDNYDKIIAGFFYCIISGLVVGTCTQWKIGHKVKRSFWTLFTLGPVPKGILHSYGVYEGFVPCHILNQALQIKQQCPSAMFIIHELTDEVEDIPAPAPDPFIEVRLGSESYFFGVWDEKEFEQEQIKFME